MSALFARLISAFALFAIFASAATKPKLVLAIVVDQFRYDYLLRFRDQYNSGLSRLLQQGAVFTDAHYIHAATVTAVGHSTFMSGATPSVSGIIANEWYDREAGGSVTSVSDPGAKMIGGPVGATGASPHRMLVSTVGDELKMRNGADSKVYSISLKDRSAVLPGGHMADGAFWFDTDSAHWVTSAYYMQSLPNWIQTMNDSHPTQKFIGAKWLPMGASAESALPFCTMVAGTDLRFCGGLEATPWGNEMIEELAEQALTSENLGHHNGTDILALSFSSNDYVGHAVGPDDPAVQDISVRTDRLFGKLFDAVERSVGGANTLVVMTADHGVAPVPEVNQARKMPGGRLNETLLIRNINEALRKKFGPGDWLMPGPVSMAYLNLKLIKEKAVDRAAVERLAADVAAAFPHIAHVYTRTQLLNGSVQQDPIGRAVSVGFYGPRSGDIFVLPEPYYLFDSTGTTHGTPYDYDTHIPVIFMGPGIKAGTYRERIAANDVAPTLAEILGVERPSGSTGKVLSEILE